MLLLGQHPARRLHAQLMVRCDVIADTVIIIIIEEEHAEEEAETLLAHDDVLFDFLCLYNFYYSFLFISLTGITKRSAGKNCCCCYKFDVNYFKQRCDVEDKSKN